MIVRTPGSWVGSCFLNSLLYPQHLGQYLAQNGIMGIQWISVKWVNWPILMGFLFGPHSNGTKDGKTSRSTVDSKRKGNYFYLFIQKSKVGLARRWTILICLLLLLKIILKSTFLYHLVFSKSYICILHLKVYYSWYYWISILSLLQ